MDNMYQDQSLNSYISSLSKPSYSNRNLQINPNYQPYSHRMQQGVVTDVNRNYTIPYNNDINSAVNQQNLNVSKSQQVLHKRAEEVDKM